MTEHCEGVSARHAAGAERRDGLGEKRPGSDGTVRRRELTDKARRDQRDVLRTAPVEPEEKAPRQDRTAQNKSANDVLRQPPVRQIPIDQVAGQVERDIGVIGDSRAAPACLPVDDVDPVSVDQKVLGLEVPVQEDDRVGVDRSEELRQICPPRQQPASGRQLSEQEPSVRERIPVVRHPTRTGSETGSRPVYLIGQGQDLVEILPDCREGLDRAWASGQHLEHGPGGVTLGASAQDRRH
nr:hypothetical protein [Streptomyces tanashiensis]